MVCGLATIKNPFLSGIIIATGGMNFGLGMGFCSPTLSAITKEFSLSPKESSFFNFCGFLAAIVGSIAITFFVKKFGKKLSSFGSSLFALASWISLGLAQNKEVLFIARLCVGLTIGIFSMVSPVFIVEVAPPNKKGQFGFMNQIGCSLGYLYLTICGCFFTWRQISFLCGLPVLIQALFVLGIPEPISSVLKASFSQLFKFPKQLAIAFGLMFFLQFSGINAVISNLETIIVTANLTVSTFVVALLANISQMIATILASIVIDKYGHRFCWSLSSIGQLIAFIMIGLHQLLKLDSSIFITGLFLEQLAFGVGTGPIPFTKAAEIFKVEVRSSAMALITSIQWALASIVVFIWPVMKEYLKLGWSFMSFGGIALFSLIFGIYVLDPVQDVDDESSDNEETENISRRLSHARDLPEL